jgi:hypothetical protein
MSDINRRLKRIEKALNVGQEEEPQVLQMIIFGEKLPPDRKLGNTIIRFVRYEDIRKKEEQQ